MSDEDLKEAIKTLLNNNAVSLGANLYKVRLKDKHRGKSGSFRTIWFWKKKEMIILCHFFPKNVAGNVSAKETKALKILSRSWNQLTESQVLKLLEYGEMKRIDYECATMNKKRTNLDEPDIMEMVEDSLRGLSRVTDMKATIREFNKLKYPEPKEYRPGEITRLMEKKLHMSQAAFAAVCNAKLSTLQKWESGVHRPTPPVNRLFHLIESGGLECLRRKVG